MGKQKVIKRKIKLVPVLILLLILALIYLGFKIFTGIKIQNIYVLNNQHLSDDYIIEQAGLTNYPSYFLNFSYKIKNRLESCDYIKTANVKKYFFGVVEISVEENNVLFYKEFDKMFVLEDRKEVDSIPFSYSYASVVNYIPDTIYSNFVTKMSKLDKTVLDKVSEIKYDPSEYDDSRFMFYMVDGNYVYVTLTKFDSLNYYNDIFPTLEGKKGILYLDSGNHFVEIK